MLLLHGILMTFRMAKETADNGRQKGSAETNVRGADNKAKYQEDKRCRQEESRRTETLAEFLRVQAAKEDFFRQAVVKLSVQLPRWACVA